MKIIFIAYREWAKKVYTDISTHPNVSEIIFCNNYKELYELDLSNFDLLITLGLSDKIENNVYNKIETIGLHCAELDRYSYGTPIQLQIIDGIIKTKHRIFKLTEPLDLDLENRTHAHTRSYCLEVDLYLYGGINEIFEQLRYTSIALLNYFLDLYPNITWKTWPSEEVIRKPRKIEDSTLHLNQIKDYTTEDLYNLIRSLESPYPNFCIEDDKGKLFIKKAIFKRKVK